MFQPTPRVYTKLPSPDESEDAKELRVRSFVMIAYACNGNQSICKYLANFNYERELFQVKEEVPVEHNDLIKLILFS